MAKFYTVTQLADLLGYSRAWVSKQVARGIINGYRIRSNLFIITEREVSKWLVKKSLSAKLFPRRKQNKHRILDNKAIQE